MTRVALFGMTGASLILTAGLAAQTPAPAPERAATEAMARRVSERVRALQREADRLAGEARTLVGDLRRLEVERSLAIERVQAADAAVTSAERELTALAGRFAALQQKRVASLPDLSGRFVELYKRGQGRYVRMLASVRDLREFGRATRAVASLAHINQQRIAEHRAMLASVERERAGLQAKTRDLQTRRADAHKARLAADRALAARSALLARIDERRDLNAQLAGELIVAQQKLQDAVNAMRGGRDVEPVEVPLGAFRGALEWPIVGPVGARFGQANRAAPSGVRNGIEIGAPEGTPVRAVHPGTVSFADPFTGYGTLAIIDHGADHYTLYGYLSTVTVARGDSVQAGQELGRVGLAPAGPPALYFEVRVDGRSVDPVQWLRKR